jgi:hypothetical protein
VVSYGSDKFSAPIRYTDHNHISLEETMEQSSMPTIAVIISEMLSILLPYILHPLVLNLLELLFLLVVVVIIIIIVSFMQGIHTRIPETNHVLRGYTVASILSLLFMVPLFLVPALALLFFYVTTFRSMCAVLNMAVFCSFLTSWFPGMLLTYFLNDLEMIPVTPIITGITLVFTFHMHCISVVRSLYFKIFSAFFKSHFFSWDCYIY